MPRGGDARWHGYVERFHAEHAGVTERILRRCGDGGGGDPYQWCAEAVTGHSPVLDVACGSGPLAGELAGWIGADRSGEELAGARLAGRSRVVRADAAALPVGDGRLRAATCSMSWQVIEPLPDALAELARSLSPGARASALVPASGPLPWRDALSYGRLQLALRTRISYPNQGSLRSAALAAVLGPLGLRVISDERRAFALPLRSADDVDELVASLYLPDTDAGRRAAGQRSLRRRVGTDLAVPLRRVVVERT